MEKKRLYIVSFGDSREYRYEYESDSQTGALVHSDPFAAIEKELNDYLSERFPGETFAFFTSPRATEVDPSHESLLAAYPPLDAKAVDELKAQLAREVEQRAAVERDNSNVPSSLFNTPEGGRG